MLKALIFLLLINTEYVKSESISYCNQEKSKWMQLIKPVTKIKLNKSSSYEKINTTYIKIKKCWNIIQNINLKRCLKRAYLYTKRLSQMHHPEHKMGFNLNDNEYYLKQNKRYFSIINLINFKDYGSLNNKKYKYIEYRSSSVANPPYHSFKRKLYLVENNQYDQWIQFTMPEKRNNKESMINLITVNKKNKNIYFMQYWYNREKNKLEKNTHVSRCYSCHQSGLRKIIPEPASLKQKDIKKLNEFNKRIANYGKVNWFNSIKISNIGPALGSKIGCTQCHVEENKTSIKNNNTRGALNAFSDINQIKYKMLNEYSMPQNLVHKKENITDLIKDSSYYFNEKKIEKISTKIRKGPWDKDKVSQMLNILKNEKKISTKIYNDYHEKIFGTKKFNECIKNQKECFVGKKIINKKLFKKLIREKNNALSEWMFDQCNYNDIVNKDIKYTINLKEDKVICKKEKKLVQIESITLKSKSSKSIYIKLDNNIKTKKETWFKVSSDRIKLLNETILNKILNKKKLNKKEKKILVQRLIVPVTIQVENEKIVKACILKENKVERK
jgi:hypothetical protein